MVHHNHEYKWKRGIRPSLGRYFVKEHRRLSLWDDPPPPIPLAETWDARAKERNRLERLEHELADQEQRLQALETRATSRKMEIHTFAPEPYQVKKPIPIVVREYEGESVASFVDANVNASGETDQEAFEAVKALMLDMLDQLSRHAKLGPKLASRLAVLREFIDGP